MEHSLSLGDTQIAASIPDLPDETLLLRRMKGHEEVGRPFEYELELLSDNHEIEHRDVLGRNLTVSVFVPDHDPRFFNGHVTDFTYTGTHRPHGTEFGSGSYARYVATIRPWIWFLTLKTDCRIFQGKTVLEIIEDTFQRHGFADFKRETTATYEPWEYCVQYRETDFDFVTRLMEHEGIYYYIDHEDGKHTLVLCDGDGVKGHRPPASGYEEVPYQVCNPKVERVFEWSISRRVDSEEVGLKDFSFKGPRDSLSAKVIAHDGMVAEGVPSAADLELYDYPGKYDSLHGGEIYARMRMEELEARYEIAEGRSNARGLAVGGQFSLAGHPRGAENHDYIIVRATYELASNTYDPPAATDAETETPTFMCSFGAIDVALRYRLPRTTARPVVQGPQTAIVVGPAGEKVWPDGYGRVKVQFHWDRYGKSDESSSCWIRVSQAWAGTNWGGMHIPHIGQEVIVEFLEGDPDRPIVTGRVYNAANMPPLDLPADKHKSILSDDYGNRVVFDATPGDQHIIVDSPHHTSGLVLGRGVVAKSESESVEYFGGAKTEVGLGAKTETMAGSKSEGILGFHAELKAAVSMETALGPSVIWRWGPNYEIGDSDQINAAEKDWMQLVTGDAILDCKAERNSKLLLCAGEKRQAVVQMDETGLELRAGASRVSRNDKVDTDPLEKRLKGYMAAAVLIHTVNSTVAAEEVLRKPKTAGVDKTNDWLTGICHALLGVVHLEGLRTARLLFNTQQKPDKIKTEIQAQVPKGKIKMFKSGQIEVEALEQNLMLWADEQVGVKSERDGVVLQAEQGAISLKAGQGVHVRKGGVKHKYFEIVQ